MLIRTFVEMAIRTRCLYLTVISHRANEA